MISSADSWVDKGGGVIVATYPTGQACIYGPMEISGPVNVYWEVYAENQATQDYLDGISMSTSSIKSLAKSSNALRTLIKGNGRGLIRNTLNQPVGYFPAHVICGRSAQDGFMDGEDVDDAEVLDLEA